MDNKTDNVVLDFSEMKKATKIKERSMEILELIDNVDWEYDKEKNKSYIRIKMPEGVNMADGQKMKAIIESELQNRNNGFVFLFLMKEFRNNIAGELKIEMKRESQ